MAPEVADLGDVMARFLARERTSPADVGSNVVVLSSPRMPTRPVPALHAGGRPAATAASAGGWIRAAGFLAASLAFHCAVLFWFEQTPPPLASVGEVSVSVEIVLGGKVAAGEASTPSPSETQSAAAPESEKPDAETPQIARAEPEAAGPEKTPPQVTEVTPQAIEAPPASTQAPAPAQPTPPARDADMPATTAEPPPQPAAMPAPAPALAIPAPEPKRAVAPTARERSRKPERGENQQTRNAPAAARSTASSGIGIGRSDADSNYRGLVAAHLGRHKQFPAEARARGDQGSTSVAFSIDGGGRVTSVRLTRASGIASFDRETEAMVRRASPFPAPPGGRAMSFTVPVSFHLR
jgi:protein TonB